jgi:hypothetical protein
MIYWQRIYELKIASEQSAWEMGHNFTGFRPFLVLSKIKYVFSFFASLFCILTSIAAELKISAICFERLATLAHSGPELVMLFKMFQKTTA